MAESDSPFAGDPSRHPALLVNNATPFNAETPLAIIGDSFITPTELFYVRNHLPVPLVDPDTYELEVTVLTSPLLTSPHPTPGDGLGGDQGAPPLLARPQD